MLSRYGNAGLYGNGHPALNKPTMYDVATNRRLYEHATVIVSDQQFPDARGYVSNRMWEVLAAGGGICLQQIQPDNDLDGYTGLQDGVHYAGWLSINHLQALIEYYLKHPDKAKKIALAGQEYVMNNHSPQHRARHLLTQLMPTIK